MIAIKPEPDEASKRCISFFRVYAAQVKKCGGCAAAPLEHWEIAHPLWRASFQLSERMHQIFQGDLAKWFRWLLDPSEWETATCWRQWNSKAFCNGAAQAKQYILSIPVVLIVELGDSLGRSWNIPSSLLPLGTKFGAPGKGVKYNIVANIYTNHTAELGASSHFIARYITPDGAKIFDYDGMRYHGHAKHSPGAKVLGWLSGPSANLSNIPAGYKLIAVAYTLEGGENAQKIFRTQRQKTAPWGLQLDSDASDQPFARFAHLVQPHLNKMTDTERTDWTSPRRQAEAVEYQRDQAAGARRSSGDKVTDTGNFRHEFVSLDDSDEEMASNNAADHDSVDEAILDALGLNAPTQSKRKRLGSATFTNSDSSDSTTPCPINCYGCGEISDGDNGSNQVQCERCRFWSHFACQPENGAVDWNDPKVHFNCQGCRPREAAQLYVPAPSSPSIQLVRQFFRFLSREIVMLPDPRARDQWRGRNVLWYPARFDKHNPHAQNKEREFEFRFLECIQWPMTEDDLMRPGRYFSQDRSFCEEILKVVLQPEQVSMLL